MGADTGTPEDSTLIQDMSEVPFPAQVAMQDPWAAYRMNVQTAFAVVLRTGKTPGAWDLFDGTFLVPSVWQSPPYITRGLPVLVRR